MNIGDDFMSDEKIKCLEMLENTSNNFLNDKLTNQDTNIINLLKEIIVVEKETISKDRLYNQLKENYFESDELTTSFINRLYEYEESAISEYIDIYLEQAYEDEISDDDINQKINDINNTLKNIDPKFLIILDKKLRNYN